MASPTPGNTTSSSTTTSSSYGSILSSVDDVETAKLIVVGGTGNKKQEKESSTYNLSFPFQLFSGVVWFSCSLWGVWIAAFYGKSSLTDWNKMNIIFPDMYSPAYPTASIGIAIHLIGAAYMAIAGAFQLVKYVRKNYPVLHRWVGRGYILASMIASLGALTFIFSKGDYGGRPADYAFATYGITFFISGVMTYYFALKRNWLKHRLWAWRLYSLSLAAWIYRFDYHYWLSFFGDGDFDGGSTWLHREDFHGIFDVFIDWAFWVPGMIIVEIVFRWGESGKTLSSFWSRFLDICWGILTVMAVAFTSHALLKLWIPTLLGTYETGFY